MKHISNKDIHKMIKFVMKHKTLVENALNVINSKGKDIGRTIVRENLSGEITEPAITAPGSLNPRSYEDTDNWMPTEQPNHIGAKILASKIKAQNANKPYSISDQEAQKMIEYFKITDSAFSWVYKYELPLYKNERLMDYILNSMTDEEKKRYLKRFGTRGNIEDYADYFPTFQSQAADEEDFDAGYYESRNIRTDSDVRKMMESWNLKENWVNPLR